jgi:formate dehydrogenase iron-sulfur subunit
MTVVRISDDALALACGADAVAAAFAAAGCAVERVSSWGIHWLEPLADIDGIGFGPLMVTDVEAVLAGTSAKAIGVIADHPFIKNQHRLTFARAGRTRPLSLDDYAATGGWTALERARAMEPGLSCRDQMANRGQGGW